MTGKAYYLTTLGAWRKHAGRLANSHWLALPATPRVGPEANARIVAVAATTETETVAAKGEPGAGVGAEGTVRPSGSTTCGAATDDVCIVPDETTLILALIEADEGAHLALQDDAEFELLPHPLAQRPISEEAQAALAVQGVGAGATMFEAAEMVARVHPLLRHRVF
ncbi:MAG: hypothetical protein WAN14_06990 [Candidatus Acidiferrales bacterium]